MGIIVNLLGILLVAALTGLGVWVAGIVALAFVVSRGALGVSPLARAGLAVAAVTVIYVGLVMLLGAGLATIAP